MNCNYETVIPSKILHADMEKMILDGEHKKYRITPQEGYLLHDGAFDTWIDADGEPLKEPILGYRITAATCSADYDFEENPRGFYTVKNEEVQA